MFIKSSAKSVKVFKAAGRKPLRIFPGENLINDADVEGLEDYFDNPMAKSISDEYFTITNSVDEEGKKRAEKAQEKNAKMNKSLKVAPGKRKKLSTAKKD